MSAANTNKELDAVSEREAFENDWEARHGEKPLLWAALWDGSILHQGEVPTHLVGVYFIEAAREAWAAWRARAALSALMPAGAAVGLPFGIIDPDYATAYTKIRIAAWQYGYAIGLQGSFTRDLDLIAVPWTAMACPADHLVKQIEYRSGLKRQGPPKEQPHGRLSWSLLFPDFEDPRWVDLSVVAISAPMPAGEAL